MNEFDEKTNLTRETVMENGKMHENEIRKIFYFNLKAEKAKRDIMDTQLA